MSWIDNLRSANWNQASGVFFLAYILGCFTAGYYLVRWLGHGDVRDVGSGSVGARNVSRVLGKPGFFLTVLFDFGKGALAVWVARHFTGDDRLASMAMVVVVAGHIWPAQLRFHGGKGMATSLGAIMVYDPRLALAFPVLFLCGLIVLRRTILPGLFALTCLPLVSLMLDRQASEAFWLSALAALVLVGHRRNLTEEIAHLAARRSLNPESDESHL
jgi:glycerol-3-phosphate acyltransferase PlsY